MWGLGQNLFFCMWIFKYYDTVEKIALSYITSQYINILINSSHVCLLIELYISSSPSLQVIFVSSRLKTLPVMFNKY